VNSGAGGAGAPVRALLPSRNGKSTSGSSCDESDPCSEGTFQRSLAILTLPRGRVGAPPSPSRTFCTLLPNAQACLWLSSCSDAPSTGRQSRQGANQGALLPGDHGSRCRAAGLTTTTGTSTCIWCRDRCSDVARTLTPRFFRRRASCAIASIVMI
jgi:hypothetical protein